MRNALAAHTTPPHGSSSLCSCCLSHRSACPAATQARDKAEAIANREDINNSSKMREIEKLYAGARAAGKGRKGAKGGKDKKGRDSKRKGPPLDKRMLADQRGVRKKDMKKRGGKAGGKGGKGGGGKGGAGKGGGGKGGAKGKAGGAGGGRAGGKAGGKGGGRGKR